MLPVSSSPWTICRCWPRSIRYVARAYGSAAGTPGPGDPPLRNDGHLGGVTGGHDLDRRDAGPGCSPAVDDHMFRRPGCDRQYERSRRHVRLGSPEREHGCQCHRHVTRETERRPDTRSIRDRVVGRCRGDLFRTRNIETVRASRLHSARSRVGGEEDRALSRRDRSLVMAQRRAAGSGPEERLRNIDCLTFSLEPHVRGLRRRIYDERRIAAMSDFLLQARHLKVELATIRASIRGRGTAWLLAPAGPTRLFGRTRFDDRAATRIDDRAAVERALEAAVRGIRHDGSIGNEVVSVGVERAASLRTGPQTRSGEGDGEDGSDHTMSHWFHGSTTSTGTRLLTLSFPLPSCP